MKTNNLPWLRYIGAFGLTLSIFVSSSMIALAATEKNLTGEIVISGNNGNSENPAVTLNGARALSGQTFFSSGVISTSETGSASINLGKLGHINLAPNSTLSLSLTENNISGKLSAGQIKVFSKEGVSVNIQTIDGIVNNDAKQIGVYTIDVQSGSTKASAEQGAVSLDNGQANMPQPAPAPAIHGQQLTALLILGGIIGAAAIYVIAGNGDDNGTTSPVR